jgi:hypothetical protein
MKKAAMQTYQLFFAVTLSTVLAVPFGCGKNDDGDGATVNGGSAGAAGGGGISGSGGRTNRGGNGGRGGQNTGPTGCEGLTPKNGEACTSQGIVCPSQLGSCVCQRSGWECFEVGGNEGGTGSIDSGGAGPGPGPGGAAGAGGEGLAGESLGGQAGAGGAAGQGGGEGG